MPFIIIAAIAAATLLAAVVASLAEPGGLAGPAGFAPVDRR